MILTDQQLAALRRRLSEVLPAIDLDLACTAIHACCGMAALQLKIGPAGLAQFRRFVQQYATRVVQHSAALQGLADEAKPDAVNEEDWTVFLRTLGRVKVSASSDLARIQRQARGRRPVEWRDWLIAVVYAVYPDGAAVKTADGHFEGTIRLLLEFLDAPVDDVHKVVLAALKRMPVTKKPSRQGAIIQRSPA